MHMRSAEGDGALIVADARASLAYISVFKAVNLSMYRRANGSFHRSDVYYSLVFAFLSVFLPPLPPLLLCKAVDFS